MFVFCKKQKPTVFITKRWLYMDVYKDMAKKAWKAILKKVQELESSGVKRSDISRMLGHSGRSAVTNWLNESTTAENASFPDMLRYLDVLGLDVCDYIPETQLPTIHRLKAHSPVETVDGEGLPTIPVLAYAGAGNPVEFFETTNVARRIPVLPEYAMPNIAAVQITGDSMEPVIKKGAYVGVIPLCGELCEGGIYLISRPPFGLVVKRVRMNAQGEIVLHSDNPKYEPLVIEPEGYEDIIIGEVVWVWQMMK